MYEKYEEAYRQHSSKYGDDVAIFYLVGKFYEMYDWETAAGDTHTSMKRAVDILGIQLSIRKGDGPKGVNGLFAGIPEQSLHKYAGMLTRQNWYVIVYDQKKDVKGAVKGRDVARILTPATHVENAGQDSAYIAGIWMEAAEPGSRDPPAFATAAIEMMTGRIATYQSVANGKRDSWVADDGFHFFQVHPPKECIIWWKGGLAPSVDILQRQFGLGQVRVRCIPVAAQGNFEKPFTREEYLREMIRVPSLLPVREALQITATPLIERALCSLLHTLSEMYPSGMTKYHCPERWMPQTNVFLGNQALVQLNMVGSQMDKSILGLYQKTLTTFGRRAMRSRILYPVASAGILKRRYDEIHTIECLPAPDREALRAQMRSVADLPRLHRRILAAEISSADIIALDQSYTSIKHVAATLAPTILSMGVPLEELQTGLRKFFSVEKAMAVTEDAFCFSEGVAPQVAAIEASIAEHVGKLSECLEAFRVWAGLPIDVLRLEYRDVLGPVMTGNKMVMTALVKALASASTKQGVSVPYEGSRVIAKKASSSLEVPYLCDTYAKILRLRGELQAAIREVIPSICDALAVRLADWDALEEWVAEVDCAYTIWNVSKENGFVRPVLRGAEEGHLEVEQLRHPLIERIMTRVEYVKHSVALDAETHGWLVYGMNASGKSSLMKAVGIAVLLAQAGCYVPASKFVFSPFRSIFTRILSTDNLWAGLSSFAVEMTELREILERADPYSLVLGDEVCSGTESISAAAIVGASLEHLHARRAKFIFATHLHGILSVPLARMKTWHLKVRYDPVSEVLVYERTLVPGPGSSLYGLEVARAMNLPIGVLDAATKIRHRLMGTTTQIDAPASQWNTGIQRNKCEVCGHGIVKDLEVHHIRQRSDAKDGKFADGTGQDDIRNLLVVCATCHDRHHANEISIQGLVQTSEGLTRSVTASVASTSESHRRSKWSDDEIKTIREYISKYPSAPMKRIVFELKERESITISVASLTKFASTG